MQTKLQAAEVWSRVSSFVFGLNSTRGGRDDGFALLHRHPAGDAFTRLFCQSLEKEQTSCKSVVEISYRQQYDFQFSCVSLYFTLSKMHRKLWPLWSFELQDLLFHDWQFPTVISVFSGINDQEKLISRVCSNLQF